MSFQWEDFLELAEEIHELGKDRGEILGEKYYRTAISRAYFAAFGSCKNFLGLRENKRTRHGSLMKKLRKKGEEEEIEELKLASEVLNSLFLLRIDADYNKQRKYSSASWEKDTDILPRLKSVGFGI